MSTFIVRFWVPVFTYVNPWNLEFGHFPQYIALFVTGAWAYQRDLLTSFSDRQARDWYRVALCCVLVFPAILMWVGAMSGTIDMRVTGKITWIPLVYSLWEGFLCVSMGITFLTGYLRQFSNQSQTGRAMSQSSFAVYISNPFIIVPLALGLSSIQLNLTLKFLLVAPIAVVLCYLIAHLLRKLPELRTVHG